MNVKRPKLSREEIGKTLANFELFLNQKIEEKGDGIFVSTHEIRGALEEEVNEHLDAVHNDNVEEQMNELFDIAVCAIWGVASLRKLRDD